MVAVAGLEQVIPRWPRWLKSILMSTDNFSTERGWRALGRGVCVRKVFCVVFVFSRGVEPIIRVGLVTMIRVGTHLNNT